MSQAPRVRIQVKFNRPGSTTAEVMLVETLPCRIGRGATNQIDLGDASVSSNHAILDWDEASGSVVLRDLGSRNGIRRTGSLDAVRGDFLSLEGRNSSFILGVLQLDIERLDFPPDGSQPTATVDVPVPVFRKKEQTVSGPQVSVTPGLISAGGPHGGLRNIRVREPTGGIRIDRARVGLDTPRRTPNRNGGQLKFERRARQDASASPGRRKWDSGFFWLGLLAVAGGSALSSHQLIDSSLSEVIPASLDHYLPLVIALLVVGIILIFSLFLVGFRFLFRRDDIDFGALFMQVAGALGVAYGISLASGSGAEIFKLEGQFLISQGVASLGRAGFFFFFLHAFSLLRSRLSVPGVLSRAIPVVAACIVLIYSAYRGAVPGGAPNQGVTLLGESPQIAPFVTTPSDSERSPAQIPTVEQAVTEFSVAVQELDSRKARLESGRPTEKSSE